MYETIVMPFDGSSTALKDLLLCREIYSFPKTNIHLLAIVPTNLVNLGPEVTFYNYQAHAHRNKDKSMALDAGVKKLQELGWNATGVLREGNQVTQIGQYVNEVSADLVLITQVEKQNWLEWLIGTSLTKKLTSRLACRVMTSESYS